MPTSLPRFSTSILPPPSVGYWLLAVAVSIFLMVGIGGVTRLTGSGLSITDWRPITGTLPPMSAEHWQSEFDKYMGSPQHRLVFPNMTVDEFKGIYWWEWIHRFWGRMIGLIFALPLIVFWARGMIPPGWRMKLLGLFVLGGLQGALGWFMVQSGLIDRPSVSPYRLAAHLGLAVLLFAAVLWLALRILLPSVATNVSSCTTPASTNLRSWLQKGLLAFASLLMLQIIYGGFVAGTKAAMAYPHFPGLGGTFVPPPASWLQPTWLNLFENTAMIAFTHRWLGIALFVWGSGLVVGLWMRGPSSARLPSALLLTLLLVQVLLGIGTTLLSLGHIPVFWGTAHQLNALLVLSVTLYLLQAFGRNDAG
jgi:heme a synthase